MSNIRDTHIVIGGMDLDSDPRFIKPDKAREIYNLRYDDVIDSKAGVLKSIAGTELTQYMPLEEFPYAYGIGATYDQKRNSLVLFRVGGWVNLWYSFIDLVNIDTGVVTNLLYSSNQSTINNPNQWLTTLGFDRYSRINDAVVVGDLLYWNDRNKRPRKINIEKALLGLTTGGYGLITEAEISAIKFPPSMQPTVTIETDTNYKLNNILGRTFIFKYRYIYDDFEKSVCSSESSVAFVSAFDVNGTSVDATQNNVIKVTVNLGSSSVQFIEVLCRIGQTGDWFVIKTIDKQKLGGNADNKDYIYSLYNNEVVVSVDQSDINRPFDFLPDIADSQEFIDNKYMAYGGCTEGFDNLSYEYAAVGVTPYKLSKYATENTPVANNPATVNTYSTSKFVEYVNPTTYTTSYVQVYRRYAVVTIDPQTFANIPPIYPKLSSTDKFKVTVTTVLSISPTVGNTPGPQTGGPTTVIGWVGNAAIGGSVDALVTTMISALNRGLGGIARAGRSRPNGSGNVNSNQFVLTPSAFDREIVYDLSITVVVEFLNGVNTTLQQSVPGFKMGDWYEFALEYQMDDGKLTTAQCVRKVYIPFYTESALKSLYKNDLTYKVTWEIGQTPPVGAVAYQWLCSGRLTVGEFKQYVIGDNNSPAIYDQASLDGSTYTYINIACLNELTRDPVTISGTRSVDFPQTNSNLGAYIYQKGDRIRFITKYLNEGAYYNTTAFRLGGYIGSVNDGYIDLEILGYEKDADGLDTNILKVQVFPFNQYEIGKGTLVEIYTPKVQREDKVYYAFGEKYKISTINGVSYHMGEHTDQGPNSPTASGILQGFDIAYNVRAMPFKVYPNATPSELAGDYVFWAESDSFSDFSESKVMQMTRVNVYDATAKRSYKNIVRRSNAYFEDTKINGLATFEFDKYLYFSSRYGRIQAMREVGYTLKVLQENKVTSVYIGRNGLKQATESGLDVMVSTDEVFSVVNPSELQYGCSNPESVIQVDRKLYFYDAARKVLVCDDPNGPDSISQTAMVSSYVSQLSGLYMKVGYNQLYDEVYFTLDNCDTLVFSNKYRNFKGFIQYTGDNQFAPELWAWAGNVLFSVRDGSIWKHNVVGNDNNFYGSAKYPSIKIISNAEPLLRKVWNSMSIQASEKFCSPEYTDITIPVSENYPLGMKSMLPAEQFISVESRWVAPYNKNAVTRETKPNVYDLVNGDALRGDYMEQRLVCSESGEVILGAIIIHCTHSPLT